jgi:carboxypeptidase family protein
MSRALVCLVALSLSASSLLAQAPARDTSAQAGTASIRGRVILAGTNQPLARVDVRAAGPALKTPRAVKTDADGRYEIDGLPAGRYVVSAVKTNFVTASFGQRRPAGPGTPFDLADRQIADKVDFALSRAGVIAGRILDEFADPVAEVQVTTMRYGYVNGERRLTPAPGRGVTNDIGEFRVFGLPPGDYVVAATLRNFTSVDSDDRTGYAPTYYPGTGNVSQAQRVTIAPGQTVSGIAMTLMPVRTSRISGIALDSSGKPLTNGFVTANAHIGMAGMGGNGGAIRPDGRFTIAGVTPGDYVLRAGVPGGESAVLPITVGDSDVNDVQLMVAPLSTLSGRVVFDSQDNVPKGSTIRISAQRPDPMLGVGVPIAGPAQDDFTFAIKVAPGHAVIRGSQPRSDWRFKRVTVNGEDVSDTGVDIPVNGAVSNIVIEFTNRLNEISGTVAAAAADPAVDAWVVIFAQDPRRWTPPSRYVVPTRPDRDNHFRARLMAGDYYAIVLDDVEPGEWTDPEYLARVRDRATPFSIADGETKSLELKISASR